MLIHEGHKEKTILKIMGFKVSTFNYKVIEFIEEEFPLFKQYFKKYEKSNVPSFMDLRYLLISCSIFQSSFKLINREKACEQFKKPITLSFLKNLVNRIYGCSYGNLKTECIALLSREAMIQNYFETPSDFLSYMLKKYPNISSAKEEFYKKAFIAYNLQKIFVLSNDINTLKMCQLKDEHIIKIISLTFKATIAQILLECYSYKLDSKKIAQKCKIFKSQDDVEKKSMELFRKKSIEIISAIKKGTFNNLLRKELNINIPRKYRVCKFCIERYRTFPYISED